MSSEYWKTWKPTNGQPWNFRRVVHLHRRAGFAATDKEMHRDLQDGPDAAMQRILEGTAYETGVPKNFDSVSKVIGDAAVSSDNPNRLQAWWLYRMMLSPDPLGEKLTLLWHNHFATSNGKVDNLVLMRNQNEIFRQYGRGKYAELFSAVMHDPAILIYLDADSNRAEHPNENLGREMLELFSMGEGNYTEADVKNNDSSDLRSKLNYLLTSIEASLG